MRNWLESVLLYALVMLIHTLHKNLGFDFFHVGKNATLADASMHDCDAGHLMLERTPCFAGNVKKTIVVQEGDTVEIMCLIYNVDFSKTLVSWWKERELQEISLGLSTRSKRFQLPRRFNEDWSLIIQNVQPSDAGGYSCQINADVVLEKIFFLKVLEKPDKKLAVDQSYWFVKDEAYSGGSTDGRICLNHVRFEF
ncbi:unnamed protein product [Mesocestoides corti]|uniref:Ig-like domain-containing protein n=1 Tax=Mesocestoides corti TaxID=53468 RepID=A0A0R3U3G6_MESCO|nr:unnamed protein product [Mesocestoides corti]